MKNLNSLFIFVGFVLIGLLSCNKSLTTDPVKTTDSTLKGKVMVEMQTSLGTIKLELDADKAPVTTKNFKDYAEAGFYNGTIFHRVIDGFMIQGGGFDKEMQQKDTRAPIKNEGSNGLSNKPMTIAMARTNDPNSATAQFFINLVDNARLDYSGPANPGYAVFGKVVEGEDVVKKIAGVSTTTKGMYENVPSEAVVIEKVSIQ